MTSAPRDPETVSETMRRVRGASTSPEIAFRRALRRRGLCFRVNDPRLPGKPDIVLPRPRLAIFLDGDFWHGRQWRLRGHASLEEQFDGAPSRAYWLQKIARNMERDCRSTAALLEAGWTVLRFWERDLRDRLDACADLALRAARDPRSAARAILPDKSVAEFFAGIGLMRLGLEREGWRARFANDIDPHKAAMYRGHFGEDEETLRVADIHALSAAEVPLCTLATASFPCNDLSLAGARGGLAGRQSSAFWGFARLLGELGERRPPLVLLENVAGLLTSRGGRDLEAVLRSLQELGYAMDAFFLDAAHFTPQSRPRLFLLGIAKAASGVEEEEAAPPPPPAESALRPRALLEFFARRPELRWRPRPLPGPPARGGAALASILEDLPEEDPRWWPHERAEYLLGQMSERHRAIADRMIAGAEITAATVFRRMRQGRVRAELRDDGAAGCLRTPRGGSARQILFAAGRGRYRARLLTPLECARLMGAGEFRITGSVTRALFGFGDAVCAPAIAWIARHALNPALAELLRGAPLRLPPR